MENLIFREIVFWHLLAIYLPQPILGLHAKIWGSKPADLAGKGICTNSSKRLSQIII
jgi:hypothetical protein